MDDFKIIYKILKAFYDAMDYDAFDYETISPETLGVSANKRKALLLMLAKEGYIEGIDEKKLPFGGDPFVQYSTCPRLTLKGLEYLSENSLMKKAAKAARNVVEIIK